MASIIIEDLAKSRSLDRAAMREIRGGSHTLSLRRSAPADAAVPFARLRQKTNEKQPKA